MWDTFIYFPGMPQTQLVQLQNYFIILEFGFFFNERRMNGVHDINNECLWV